jgi:fructose-bisphosphate aldolase, class II
VATIRAAEAKRSPVQILLFPWSMSYANTLLVNLAADACASASVPVSLHLDHAQDEGSIRRAADWSCQQQQQQHQQHQHRQGNGKGEEQGGSRGRGFDSIMVDMSHHDTEENLSRTRELVAYCHARGVAVEAEPGRIDGGEDGVMDTTAAGLEGLLTDVDEAVRFVDTGIDFLAPSFGNVHGSYGGTERIRLDLER